MDRFSDASFPDRIAFGAESDPMWSTLIVIVASGFETATQQWAHARHKYDLSFAVRNATDYALIRTHFHMMRGRAKVFAFKDFLDYQCAASEGVTTAVGGTYQLYKRYGSGSDLYDRKITRPKSGTLAIFRTRSGVTTSVTGSAMIDYSGGTFTITGHVGGDVYTWSGQFDVPCRYDVDQLPAVVTNKEPGSNGELLVECGSIPLIEVPE